MTNDVECVDLMTYLFMYRLHVLVEEYKTEIQYRESVVE